MGVSKYSVAKSLTSSETIGGSLIRSHYSIYLLKSNRGRRRRHDGKQSTVFHHAADEIQLVLFNNVGCVRPCCIHAEGCDLLSGVCPIPITAFLRAPQQQQQQRQQLRQRPRPSTHVTSCIFRLTPPARIACKVVFLFFVVCLFLNHVFKCVFV